MNELRKKFEGLDWVLSELELGEIEFNEELDAYVYDGYCDSQSSMACWLSGAWRAFQEQQKKIDEIVECVKNNTADYDLDIKIKELLK